MTKLLINLFIKDKENTADSSVREKYGTLASSVGIATNIILAAIKLIAGFLAGSVAIIADAFNKNFFKAEKGFYETNSWVQKGNRNPDYRQTSNLLPLSFGMVEEENKESVLNHLAESFISRGYRLDTGCTGTKHVLPVLFENG